jgi:prepilin-type N-terminal cleavage/methylation domain-containing protein
MRRRGPARAGGGPAAGFTLLEILVVLTLLVILVGFAWPVMENQIAAAQLPESADRVRDMLFMARAEAALEHRRVRIRFVPDEQHPIIEYEPDSILEPGHWEPVQSAWTREPMLLADIQVHDVLPGRPVYLEPLSFDSDPSEQQEESLQELEYAAEFDASAASSEMADADMEIDEARPPIIFEADGSTEWATIILARLPLKEVLEEAQEQLWVVLDGRTGLAQVREKVTEAQLSDEEFYVQREKLELPTDADISNLSMDVGGQGISGLIGTGLSIGGMGLGGAGGQGAGNAAGLNGLPGLAGNNSEPAATDENGRPVEPADHPPTDAGQGDDLDNAGDPQDLEGALQDADLTDEERENIRRTMGGRRGGGRQDGGRRGGGRRGGGPR